MFQSALDSMRQQLAITQRLNERDAVAWYIYCISDFDDMTVFPRSLTSIYGRATGFSRTAPFPFVEENVWREGGGGEIF